MDKKGFTLMEIVIVVILLGIIAAVGVPKIINGGSAVLSGEGQHTLTVLLSAQKRYQLENNAYTGVLANLDVTIPTSKYFNDPVAVDGTGNIVATVSSKTANTNLTYTLSIDTAGIITCAGADCDKIRCTRGGGGNQCNQ